MEFGIRCGADGDPAKCSRAWWVGGHEKFVATDYESYYILSSCVSGYNSMQTFYAGSSEPL